VQWYELDTFAIQLATSVPRIILMDWIRKRWKLLERTSPGNV